MDGYFMVSIGPGEGSLKNFTVNSRGKTSVVKLELEITDSYALSSITQRLHEAMNTKPSRAPRKAGS